MTDKFIAKYQVDDGYAGPARPQSCEIEGFDLFEGMSEDEIRALFHEYLEEDFRNTITYYAENEDEFVEWALGYIDKLEEEEEEEG